jgi:hypothetical protein
MPQTTTEPTPVCPECCDPECDDPECDPSADYERAMEAYYGGDGPAGWACATPQDA